MELVRITMEGYGCEINRGTVHKEDYLKLEKSLNNIWQKNLFEEIEKKVELKKDTHTLGLIKGEIKIEVEGEIIIDTSVKVFETLVCTIDEVIEYPKTEEVVITTVQHQEGIFLDTIFIIDGKFETSKLSIIKKEINDKVDNSLESSLYCELYYDGQLIPMTEKLTDLRMSRLYFENIDDE